MQGLFCVCELTNSSITLRILQKVEKMSQLIAHELGNLVFAIYEEDFLHCYVKFNRKMKWIVN
jgi:hypothetical protein